MAQPNFGHTFRKEHFPQLTPSFRPVNHGSFGLPPKVVMDAFHKALDQDFASPDTYFRAQQAAKYKDSLTAVAKVLNCAPENLAFVTNATSGVNTILRSLPLQKGDVIVLPNTTYGACNNTVRFLEQYIGIVPVVVDLEFPMLSSAIVAKFRAAFEKTKTKLALFDTVVSMPGVKLPYVELTQLCKEFGVLSLVDGAHLVGLIPIDLGAPDFKPDFFTSNLHKWFSAPRGLAVLYVDPKFHNVVQTMPVSHSFVPLNSELEPEKLQNLLILKFTFTGSTTYAATETVSAAIKFRQEVCGGEDAIRNYCEALARNVGDMALSRWEGTTLLENDEKSLITAMVTLTLPFEQFKSLFDIENPQDVSTLIDVLPLKILKKYNTFIPIAKHFDKLVFRFSAQIYTELSDFEYALDALKKESKAYFESTSLPGGMKNLKL